MMLKLEGYTLNTNKSIVINLPFVILYRLQFSSLSIFFKENQFITSKRSELVGLTDFVSSCGGLLGLFMGVSILSIVEFIYYFSLRLFCSIRSEKLKEKSKMLPKLKSRSNWVQSKQEKPWYIGQ